MKPRECFAFEIWFSFISLLFKSNLKFGEHELCLERVLQCYLVVSKEFTFINRTPTSLLPSLKNI